QATDRLLLDSGLAYFVPGSFVDDTGLSEESTLIYLQARYDF
ncbi:MAG: hypothetical protein ACJAVK_000836, partial [Akkermansiaceae bacterium]